MKLVILKQPWVPDKPFICVYDGGSGKPQLATQERFATEDEARTWCQMKISGAIRVAEFDLPDVLTARSVARWTENPSGS